MRDTLKSFNSRLMWLRESVVKAAKDRAGELIIASLVLAGGIIWYKLQIATQAVLNISAEEAWKMARAQIPYKTVAVFPFRNIGMNEQLVAALVRSDPQETQWDSVTNKPGRLDYRILLIHHLDSGGYRTDETNMGFVYWPNRGTRPLASSTSTARGAN